ncbi:hypothetical protein RM578_09130 [Staphylococcus haemolyticus]|uniref:hypothetical protein n=1 Tax=Staphylococcus haemolyticus TaxID=1283 RepID=UPI00187A1734|nr:hypothetical protein [Staphylococcus haemolyticus]MBE7355441.1 hypothetical protein [Staphylococcus haemolyticus]MDT0705562.1 hypothetical protein [Staphylococcus haemolyticus]MDT0738611.1 hypothetical protein [Staphylococcus haemolyticus]
MEYMDIIKESVGRLAVNTRSISKAHVSPDISEKVLENAEKACKGLLSKEYIIAILDTSLTGKGKEGIYFTGEKIVIKQMLETPEEILLADIIKVEIDVREKNNKFKDYNIIKLKGGSDYYFSEILSDYVNAEAFAKIINSVLDENEEEEFIETNQVVPLQELSEKAKLNYVKILCNYAYFNDEVIDAKEYAEIISFIVRIELDKYKRLELRSYMAGNENQEDTMDLVESLIDECKEVDKTLIIQSLMKDLIAIYMLENIDEEEVQDKFIFSLAEELDVTKEELDVFIFSYQQDRAILEQRLNDSDIKKTVKDLSSKAAAVGVPMAALYMSGTAGVSAIGMTTGLASLGMGGILGFSGMFTGVGVLALLGIGSYQGIKKLTGLNDEKNNKQRELMLQEIIKNNQQSLQILIEDVNNITEILIEEIKKGKENTIKIQKLAKILNSVSQGSKEVINRVDHFESENTLVKVPQVMKVEKIEELVTSEDKKILKDKVLESYTLDENGNLRLKYNLSRQQADELLLALESLGFFNLTDNAAATVKSSAKNLLSNFRN